VCAGEVAGTSGEGVGLLHDSAMRRRSRAPRRNAKTICPQDVHRGFPTRVCKRRGLAVGETTRKPLA
jgi:hypothetical protein